MNSAKVSTASHPELDGLASRMSHFIPSPIRAMFELAQTMKNPIDLSIGQPDFEVPESVRDSAIKAIQAGKNRYTVTSGIPDFRKAIKEYLAAEKISVEETMAVAGASGGLQLSLLALADEQTEVLVADPYFVCYAPLIQLAGAKLKIIDTYPDFKITPERVERAVRENSSTRTTKRILIFNTPVNPTGMMYTANETQSIAATCKALKIRVISDEAYDRFAYDFSHESYLKYDSSAVLVRTMGKTWAMTGWRVGFVAGPKFILDAMAVLQQFTYVCVNSPAQWAGIEALRINMQSTIDLYRMKRDYIYSELQKFYPMQKPQGAFYAFPEVRGDPAKFLEKCIANELLITPGKAFSQKNTHFRISFATSDEKLQRGVEILKKIS